MASKRKNNVRRCSRNGCRWPASASFTYAYAKSVVWIEDLIPQPHPAAYDLCAAHAERLAVPVGWLKEDLRVVPPAVTPIRPDIVLVQPLPAPVTELWAKPDPGASAEVS